ncbi:MAG TPA: SDR family NAD(P)-dependent oxidoreductase [Anaeromyxobacter sp.]|nr:SDR family NAD(P)-dependent oxidoreductase [Anaeromyxobacter sp.]
MPDLSGRVVLVTGASSGIGLAASRELAAMGAELVLVGRDAGRLAAAEAEVKAAGAAAAKPGPVSSLRCDFAALAEVRALAAEVLRRWPRLHVLVNNAGGVSGAREVTADGYERTFAVNHLAPYLLTRLLLDRLKESAPARVVTVASTGHHRGDLDFSDLQMERGYAIMRAYGRSKLANILFTRELARRLAGSRVTATCLHPGAVATRIWDGAPSFARVVIALAKRLMLSPEKGARTIVQLAAAPDAEVARYGGVYLEKGKPAKPSALARDDQLARRLWDESARLVGVES